MARHENSHALIELWNTARSGNVLPSKRNMPPSAMTRFLPWVFILSHGGSSSQDDEIASFKLAGTSLCALYGRELTNQSFVDLWDSVSKHEIAFMNSCIEEDRRGVIISSTAHNGYGTIPFETVILPILGENEEKLSIGVQTPMKNHWSLGAHPIGGQTIIGMRSLNEEGSQSRPLIGSNTPSISTPLPDRQAGRRFRHLTVVQ